MASSSADARSTSRSTRARGARHPREWTVLGKPVPRVDIPAMATGPIRVRPRRARARHAARAGRPAAGRRRDARRRRRELGEGCRGRREGRRQEQLRRRRRREAVAGDPGGRQAEGDVDAGHRPAEPGRFPRLPAEPEADAGHAGRRIRRTSTRNCRRAARGPQGHVSLSVSDARIGRQLVRRRRRAGRQGDDLVADPGGASAPRAPPRWCSACSPRTCA